MQQNRHSTQWWVATLIIATFLALQAAFAGWTGPSTGSASYLNTGNWSGATIDDDFSGVTLTGDLETTFSGNHSTTAGMNFNYGGAYNLSLRSDDTATPVPRTIVVNGDISVVTGAGGRTVTVGTGSNTNPHEITLDLGSVQRTITVGGTDTLSTGYIEGTGGIVKEGAGTLAVWGELSANPYGKLPSGAIEINAGTLQLNRVVNSFEAAFTVNSGGRLELLGGSNGFMLEEFNLNGGTLHASATGDNRLNVRPADGDFVSTGGTIDGPQDSGSGVLYFFDGGKLRYETAGGNETPLAINALINIPSSNATATWDIANGVHAVDVTHDGRLSAHSSAKLVKAGAGTLEFTGGYANTLRTLDIANGAVLMSQTGVGSIVANHSASTVTIGDGIGTPGSAVLRYSGGVDNQIQQAKTVIDSDGVFDLNGWNHATGGSFDLQGGSVTLGGGTLRFNNPSVFSMTGGSVSGAGALQFGNRGCYLETLPSASTSVISSDVHLAGWSPREFRIADGTAAVDLEITGSVFTDTTGDVIKTGNGLLLFSGNNSYATTEIQTGTLVAGHDNAFAAGAVTVFDGAAIGVANGATVTNNTTFAGTYTLVGDGTFKPANMTTLTVGSGSTVSPGLSAGTLTVGDITFEPDAALSIEIFGASSYDRLVSDGVLTIGGGVLNVTFEDGYQPGPAGATYAILDWLTFGGGAFDQVNLPVLGSQLSWSTDMLYVDGTIAAIPEPTSLALLGLGALALLKRRR